MTAEGHVIFAVASVIFAKRAHLTPELANGGWWHLLAAALLTCLLPDLDHPESLAGQRLKWLSRPLYRALGHRGFTHSLLAVAGMVLLLKAPFARAWSVPADVLQGMVIGYLSHIIADMLTSAGVPLLWPCRWRFCLPLINSRKGKQPERLFCLVLLVCVLFLPAKTLHFSVIDVPDRCFRLVKAGFHQLFIR